MERTLSELLKHITGATSITPQQIGQWLEWPPDAFAIASVFLEETGAYRQVISPPAGQSWPPEDGWADSLEANTRAWHVLLDGQRSTLPIPLRETRDTLHQGRNETLAALAQDWRFVCQMLRLLASSDDASRGFGMSQPPSFHRFEINERLAEEGTLSRFPAERIVVLPKQHTPQAGIGLRSLSFYLCAMRSEVSIQWSPLPSQLEWSSLEILLLPWPLQIEDEAFRPVPFQPLSSMSEEHFGFFEFAPDWSLSVDLLVGLINRCYQLHGPNNLDLIVFPEATITEQQLDMVESALSARLERPPAILAGVRRPSAEDCFGANVAILSIPYHGAASVWNRVEQHKHHRWYLDESQIRNYWLGAQLHPQRRWWEAAEVPDRTLGIFALNNELLICPLVCEDLARQDPVAPYVRSIGPSLVIALLLDGPQLPQRWSGRYATVLADDPGSSVLTLSPYGMVRRSVPPGRRMSPCVALWKDAVNGDQEIHLPSDEEDGVYQGILLKIGREQRSEWAADGRGPIPRNYLVLRNQAPLLLRDGEY